MWLLKKEPDPRAVLRAETTRVLRRRCARAKEELTVQGILDCALS
jgi:hypothetical protein